MTKNVNKKLILLKIVFLGLMIVAIEGSPKQEKDPIQSDPIQSNPTQSNPKQSNPILLDPIQSNLKQSNPIQLDPTQFDTIQLDPMQSNPMPSEPITFDEYLDSSFQPTSFVGSWLDDSEIIWRDQVIF